jgi:hypothetical protein
VPKLPSLKHGEEGQKEQMRVPADYPNHSVSLYRNSSDVLSTILHHMVSQTKQETEMCIIVLPE